MRHVLVVRQAAKKFMQEIFSLSAGQAEADGRPSLPKVLPLRNPTAPLPWEMAA